MKKRTLILATVAVSALGLATVHYIERPTSLAIVDTTLE